MVIRKFALDQLDAKVNMLVRKYQAPTNTIEMLSDQLASKAGGVFLWLKLALDDIIRYILAVGSVDDLFSHLDVIPPELNDMYQLIWDTLQRQSDFQESIASFQVILANEMSLFEF
jgi:hypothetical protein